jgi:hypothetical protein
MDHGSGIDGFCQKSLEVVQELLVATANGEDGIDANRGGDQNQD